MNNENSRLEVITLFEDWYDTYCRLSGDNHASERKEALRGLYERGATPGVAFDVITGRILEKD